MLTADDIWQLPRHLKAHVCEEDLRKQYYPTTTLILPKSDGKEHKVANNKGHNSRKIAPLPSVPTTPHTDCDTDTVDIHTMVRERGLFTALWYAHKAVFWRMVIVSVLYSLFEISKPVFLRVILTSLEQKSTNTIWTPLLYSGGLFVVSCISAFLHAQYELHGVVMGVRVMASTTSLIFAKALRLRGQMSVMHDKKKKGNKKSGRKSKDNGMKKGVNGKGKGSPPARGKGKDNNPNPEPMSSETEFNLVSSDPEIVRYGFYWGIRSIGYTLMAVIALILLFTIIGISALPGLILLVISVSLQGHIGRRQGRLQESKQQHTDNRLALLKEIFVGIRVLKLNAWEPRFFERISAMRSKELEKVKGFRIYWAFGELLSGATAVLVGTSSIILYAALGNTLTPSRIFTTLALFTILRQPLTFMSMIVGYVTTARISIQRMERYLARDEITLQDRAIPKGASPGITVVDADFYWDLETEQPHQSTTGSGSNMPKVNGALNKQVSE